MDSEKSRDPLFPHVWLVSGGELGRDAVWYAMQETGQRFATLAGHHHHHLLVDHLAHTCQMQTWARFELPFAMLVFGELRTLLAIEERLCNTEKERHEEGLSGMGLWWRKGRCKTLPLGACEAAGNKALGNHTGKAILVSVSI